MNDSRIHVLRAWDFQLKITQRILRIFDFEPRDTSRKFCFLRDIICFYFYTAHTDCSVSIHPVNVTSSSTFFPIRTFSLFFFKEIVFWKLLEGNENFEEYFFKEPGNNF